MKHILIDARESGTSTGRYIDKLIEYLYLLQTARPQLGGSMECVFTVLTKPQRISFFKAIAPTFTCITTEHKEFTFAEQIKLKAQIEQLKPDLVHFPAAQQPVRLNRRATRVVTTIQDLTTLRFRNPNKNLAVYTLKQQVYRRVVQRVAHTSALLITPSQFVKDDVVAFSGIDPAKVTVTYESADILPSPAKAVPTLADGTTAKDFIMYVGRPTPHKNLSRLIEAFGLLRQSHPGLYLALIGKKDGNYDRIAQAVVKQGVGQVVFTGFVSDQQLRWLYEHCQAYTFPSLSEGFGLPGLEAMRHGAPVVSSNATCLPEIYGDGAHYFNPLNTNDIASKIGEVLDNPVLKKQLIANGHIQVSRYSWSRMAQRTLDVYQRAFE